MVNMTITLINSVKKIFLDLFIISYLWAPLLPKVAGLWIYEYFAVLVYLILFLIKNKSGINNLYLAATIFVWSILISFLRGAPSFEISNWSGVAIALALHSSVRMRASSKGSVYLGILGIYLLLYTSTNNFQNFLWKGTLVGDEYSVNIFGRLILSAYIFTFAVKDIHNRRMLLILLLFLNMFTMIFVESRQLYVLTPFIAFSIIQMYSLRFFLGAVSFFAVVYLYSSADLEALFSLNFESRSIDTLRTQIYSCFIQNMDVASLMIGGYDSRSGKCAMNIVGVNYLHSIYLEAFAHLGLIGYILILISLWSLYVVWMEKNYQRLTLYLCIIFYGMVESIGVWVLFYIAVYPLMSKPKFGQVFKGNSIAVHTR